MSEIRASPDSSADWNAARNHAAVFNLTDHGRVELAGPDAVAFLHNLCTNDIKNLPAGQGCEFFLTTNKARTVAYGYVQRLQPTESPRLLLQLAPGKAAAVIAHLNHFIVSEQVEIIDRTSTIVQFHVAGPIAPQVMSGLFTLEAEQDQVRFSVRHDRLNLPGFDLVCPVADGPGLLQRLIGAGAIQAEWDAFNILRVEAGLPLDGLDIDNERFVVEVGRVKQAICYTKGCYLGQEPIVMARDRGHANRLLLGLRIEAPAPLPAGAKVMLAGQEVGQVTSSVWSPALGSVIALAYLKRGSHDPGTSVDVAGNSAVVASLPFA